MKLPNQTRGPVKLTKVEFYPRLSEETLAFNAVVEINGMKGEAFNEGHGGPTSILPREVAVAINEYAKTLPPSTEHGFTVGYDADMLVGEMVGEAADKVEKDKEHRKMARKGYKVYCEFGNRGIYFTVQPTLEAMIQKFGEDARSAKFEQIAV